MSCLPLAAIDWAWLPCGMCVSWNELRFLACATVSRNWVCNGYQEYSCPSNPYYGNYLVHIFHIMLFQFRSIVRCTCTWCMWKCTVVWAVCYWIPIQPTTQYIDISNWVHNNRYTKLDFPAQHPWLALFPVLLHLQCLIAYNIQKQRKMAWGILPRLLSTWSVAWHSSNDVTDSRCNGL